ncbi:MAG: hypothetical protein H6839_11075 [Planctomycetes bacterium]|nr:hypothetical protein [Planctomycetota bacterium]
MKRLAGWLVCVWLAAPLMAQNAPPVDDKIDSPLEYFFGALALIALVMTWVWLWMKSKQTLQPRSLEPPPEPESPAEEPEKSE